MRTGLLRAAAVIALTIGITSVAPMASAVPLERTSSQAAAGDFAAG
ncbi:hypothetical protein [Streptomyces sp. WAC06614]|nr:hypothetical protein [Streptomyces sp. WAC06614]